MKNLSPLERYQQALSDGSHQPDDVQYRAISCLNNIAGQLVSQPEVSVASSGIKTLLGKFFTRQPVNMQPVRGLYMWGGVGRGKTWLMDLFYHSLSTSRKQRLHFHRFMLQVHEALTELQGHSDPLDIIAGRFKSEIDVLCFDEFFVSDITDAMLLGTLMKTMFDQGITLIATSNIPPDDLYSNGLQRTRFLPAIDAIKTHCDVMNVDAGIDYRLRTLTQANLWLSPLNATTSESMAQLYQTLSGSHQQQPGELEINHRLLATLGMDNQILAVTFHTLCVEPRNQNDYIALSRLFHSVFLYDMPLLSSAMESEARRFIALVDEFYERHVKLVISAAAPLSDIYQGELLKFEFQRCLSRLQEMQSEDYLAQPHNP